MIEMIGIILLSVIGYLFLGFITSGLFFKWADFTIEELVADGSTIWTIAAILFWPLVAVLLVFAGLIFLFELGFLHIFKISETKEDHQLAKNELAKLKTQKKEKKEQAKAAKVAAAMFAEEEKKVEDGKMSREDLIDLEE